MENLPSLVFDGEDYWRFDPERKGYRILDLEGESHHHATHPPVPYENLESHYPAVRLAEESEVIWRTIRFILERLNDIP